MATTKFIIPFFFQTDDDRDLFSRRGLRGGCPPARRLARPYRLEPFFSPPGRAGWGAGEKRVKTMLATASPARGDGSGFASLVTTAHGVASLPRLRC